MVRNTIQAGVLVVLLGVSGNEAAAAPAPAPAPAIAASVVNRESYPARKVEFAQGVVGLPDVTYATYFGYRPLKLDLYLPPAASNAKGPRGVVVYVHGGGWRNGTARFNGAFEH